MEVLTDVEDQSCVCVCVCPLACLSWVSVSGSMIDGSVRPQRSELLVCVCARAWLVLAPLLWQDRLVAEGLAVCVCVCVCEVAEVRVLLSVAARLFPVPTTRLTRTRCVFTEMCSSLCELHTHTQSLILFNTVS